MLPDGERRRDPRTVSRGPGVVSRRPSDSGLTVGVLEGGGIPAGAPHLPLNSEDIMTGKQFKEFAALVPDNAVVEMDEGYSSANWKPIGVAKIRARLIVTPKVEE